MPFRISAWILSNWASETTGPITKSPWGSPTVIPDAVRRAMAMASSIRAAGTSIREGALHVCPELPIMVATPLPTFSAKASSSSTMFGLLPPSSWVTLFTVGAAFLAMSMPARVEPVKEIMSTSG